MITETLSELIFQYDRFSIGCKNSFTKLSIDDYDFLLDKSIPDFEYRCVVISLDLARIHYEERLYKIEQQNESTSYLMAPFTVWCQYGYGENILKEIRCKMKSRLKKDIVPNDIIDYSNS